MAHAHKHFGAEKVVTAAAMHASADMNVTPLIDVLLVLLVIFMAALPVGQVGVDINLPAETRNQAEATPTVSQILLDYTSDRVITVNQRPVNIVDLERELRDIYATRKDKTMFIAGAETIRYGDIIEVIDAARGAGVDKVGIVTAGMRRAAGVQSN